MLRTSTKRKIIEMLNAILSSHHDLRNVNGDELFPALQSLQKAAMDAGEAIEAAVTHEKAMITVLEQYCEEIFQISREPEVFVEKKPLLDALIRNVLALVEERPSVYQIVFMPYNASMWDSLESIYEACARDENCECLVVPIPYFHFDASKQEWLYCYEGDRFPEEVPVLDFRKYHLELEHPDVVYIHNPYDDCNYVTSVHPAFYSSELKKYAKKLVYVPYYVTSGFVSDEHLQLPVYYNMDYMIAQSDYYKSAFEHMPFYNKILPMGSPKIDRIIQLCRKQPELPEEWRIRLGHKKRMMLNTSLNCFLRDGDLYLKKIRYIFELVKADGRAAIIWRPHPLLESTIASMRPHLMEEYRELVTYFEEEGIGVLDRTPDIAQTVAIADAYIGEEATSVINLFGAAGKPIFILNNLIRCGFTEPEQRSLLITDMVKLKGTWWITSDWYSGLFRMDGEWQQIAFSGKTAGQHSWYADYSFLAAVGEELYLSPNMAAIPVSYHTVEGKYRNLMPRGWDDNLRCGRVIAYRQKVFYLPLKNDMILEFDRQSGQWRCHTECMSEIKRNLSTGAEADAFDCAAEEQNLWVTFGYTNRILKFDMLTGQYQIIPIGAEGDSYSGIAVEKAFVWLAEVHSGKLIRWDRTNGEEKCYEMPEGYHSWSGIGGRECAHQRVFDMGRWVVTTPEYSNCMVKLDKETGKTSLLISEFWEAAERDGKEYQHGYSVVSGLAVQGDEKTLWVQRLTDYMLAEVDVETGTYKMHVPKLSEEAYMTLTADEDGFEKMGKRYGFFRRESRIFTFENFVDDLVNERLENVRDRQKKELSDMVANLDGTCGERVHEFIMRELDYLYRS